MNSNLNIYTKSYYVYKMEKGLNLGIVGNLKVKTYLIKYTLPTLPHFHNKKTSVAIEIVLKG